MILSVSGSQYCLLKNPQEWIVPVKVDLFVIKPMCDGEKRSKYGKHVWNKAHEWKKVSLLRMVDNLGRFSGW